MIQDILTIDFNNIKKKHIPTDATSSLVDSSIPPAGMSLPDRINA